MAGPWGFNFAKFYEEEERLAAVRHHELRHLRRLRVVLLILLSPIWLPFAALWFGAVLIGGLFNFLLEGPS
jgi:hypothetical protein